MCDDSLVRLGVRTSFSIDDIMLSNEPAVRHMPAVVRPWETVTASTSQVMRGGNETCVRLTAAALTLYHWQTISLSPLSALYQMTTSNFVDSLNCDRLQGLNFVIAVLFSDIANSSHMIRLYSALFPLLPSITRPCSVSLQA